MSLGLALHLLSSKAEAMLVDISPLQDCYYQANNYDSSDHLKALKLLWFHWLFTSHGLGTSNVFLKLLKLFKVQWKTATVMTEFLLCHSNIIIWQSEIKCTQNWKIRWPRPHHHLVFASWLPVYLSSGFSCWAVCVSCTSHNKTRWLLLKVPYNAVYHWD